jgi:3-deoxy-manno-octulosonate cytidylyltransferase (CMP-KDO synthetase)
VYERACRSKTLTRVVVATDDLRVRDVVAAFGGEARLTAGDHPSGTDRVAEVAASLSCELIVNIQGDEPLIEPAMIDEGLSPFFAESDVAMGTLCRRLESREEWQSPHVVKVVRDCRGYALYFSRAPIPYHRVHGSRFTVHGQAGGKSEGGTQSSILSPEPLYYKHIGLYVYRRDFLLRLARLAPTPLEETEQLEQLRALEHGYPIRVVETRHDSVGVDTPEDLTRIERMLAAGG